MAAKMIVYAGDPEKYFAFITPEAYHALSSWMKYRKMQAKTLPLIAGSSAISPGYLLNELPGLHPHSFPLDQFSENPKPAQSTREVSHKQ